MVSHRSWRVASVALLLALSSACSNSDPTTSDPAYVVTPAAVFAGGTATIHSAALRTLPTSATLTLGTASLPVNRIDDTTISVVIPDQLSGTYQPTLTGNAAVSLPSITVYGYADSKSWDDQGLYYDVYPIVRNGDAVILGTDFPLPDRHATGLALVDLDAGTSQHVAIGYSSMRGPGLTTQDGEYLYERTAPDSAMWIERWNVNPPTPVKIDSMPWFDAQSAVSPWQAIELGPAAWAYTTKEAGTKIESAEGETTVLNDGQPHGIVFSPMHDRALTRGGGDVNGVAVLSAPQGTVAYTLDLRIARGAAFSADGSVLAVAGDPLSGSGKAVRLVNALTGATLGDTTITETPFAVSVDPRRPYVYVGVTASDGVTPAILVFQRSPFHLVGRMQVPSGTLACAPNSCDQGTLALSGGNDLYIWWSYYGPSYSFRFTLPSP